MRERRFPTATRVFPRCELARSPSRYPVRSWLAAFGPPLGPSHRAPQRVSQRASQRRGRRTSRQPSSGGLSRSSSSNPQPPPSARADGLPMELQAGLDFARDHHQGVLVTRHADGRPQLSNILYHLSGDAAGVGEARHGDPVARISATDARAKTRNLRRDPAASLYVPGDSFWSYVVLDGTAELSPVAGAHDDPTVEELVELYRSIRGEEHPNWTEYRSVMVAERRLVIRLHPVHAYGMIPG